MHTLPAAGIWFMVPTPIYGHTIHVAGILRQDLAIVWPLQDKCQWGTSYRCHYPASLPLSRPLSSRASELPLRRGWAHYVRDLEQISVNGAWAWASAAYVGWCHFEKTTPRTVLERTWAHLGLDWKDLLKSLYLYSDCLVSVGVTVYGPEVLGLM